MEDMRPTRIRPYIPQKLFPTVRLAYRKYMDLRYRYTDLRDRRRPKDPRISALPPASLRYRVHGSIEADQFLRVGKRCSNDIEMILKKVGKNFDAFSDVLDFGCGCGRTLLWFESRPKSTRLHGTDIDAEAISWCRKNLERVEFSINDSLPPLRHPSENFDLIYAVSVFTHLNESFQFQWLRELKRVLRPGGILLLTLHGRNAWRNLSGNDLIELEEKGFKFVVSNNMQGVFPEWYQNAFHSKEYVLEQYSKYFDVLTYIPKGIGDNQDVVVLQKP